MTRKRPQFNRHTSNQIVGTPEAFLDAVRAWRPITIDLAASAHNAAAPVYITEEINSLADHIDWTRLVEPGCVGWLNPPFNNIRAFAEKCDWFADNCTPGATVTMLVPSGTSTNWWAELVHGRCIEVPIRPRLTFVGQTHTFPKELTLYMYGRNFDGQRLRGEAPWAWKKQSLQSIKLNTEFAKF